MGAGTALRKAAERLGYPLAVKPAAQGSALGLSVVADPEDLSSAAMGALNHGDRLLIERFVTGPEISIPVKGLDLDPLPAVEIRTKEGVYDFETRVSPGMYEYICPATSAVDQIPAAQKIASEACRVLGVRDFARVDMRIGDDGPTILDVKTCPGLTETSTVPLAVAQSGSNFEDFAGGLIEAALTRAPTARAKTAYR
jgi:D-alanine-D-alanine ligase